MKRLLSLVVVAAMALMFLGAERQITVAKTNTSRIERGRALVNFGGCHDCHTPFKVGPHGAEPDMSRALSGHPANLVMPAPPKMNGPWVWAAAGTNTAFAGPWGVSYSRNLTPDQVSGLGIWTEDMFVKTMRTGRHMGVSRPILPPMPWENLNTLPDEDLKSIYAYLRTIKPIRNEVPDPVIASQK
jgi:mono/diheme cytochrome c family protein